MPSRTRFSSATTLAQGDLMAALLSGGYLRIFEGEQPDEGDDPVPDVASLLVELRFTEPGLTDDDQWPVLQQDYVRQGGHAGWFRALRADGTTSVFDGHVGTEDDDDLVLDRLDLEQDALVKDVEFRYDTLARPAAAAA